VADIDETGSTTAPRTGDADRGIGHVGGILLHVLMSRALFFGASVLGSLLVGEPFVNRDVALPDPKDLWAIIEASAINYGDFNWYGQIAGHGYDVAPFSADIQRNWAFFPLFPLIQRLVTAPAMMFWLPQLTFAAAMLMLSAYLRKTASSELARGATLLMIYFPFSYVLSQFRPEAFLLLFSVLALAAAQGGRPWLSAGSALAAGFAKPNAFLISLLLARHYPGGSWPRPSISVAGLAMLTAPGLGLAAMCLIMWTHTGDPLAWAKIQGAWGAAFGVTPWRAWLDLLDQPLVVGRGGWDPVLLNWLIFVGLLTAIVGLARRRMCDWVAFAALCGLFSFSNHAVFVLGKHLATCFPMFVGLAIVLPGRDRQTALLAVFVAALMTMGLFNGARMAFTQA
jgi:hypothetical protein